MPEKEREEQRAWLSSVLDLLPVPAQLVEFGTARVLFTNAAARRLPFAAPCDVEAPGAAFATDADGGRIPDDQWPDRRAARGEVLDGLQITWHEGDGQSSYAVSSRVVPSLRGQPALALLTYLDVTKLRAAEADLREAIRARDEFFSFATHELKDPLSALLLSVEVLVRVAERRQGAVPPEMLAERLAVCKRQGERLARLIGNLLDVSRIRHGRIHLQVEALDLRDLVLEVVGQFREQAREAGVPLVVEPSGPVVGYFDRIHLEHVVGNLLSNALKYGDGRPVTVRLGGDEATATVEVEDRGIGIGGDDLERIFQQFERATGNHRDKSLGLGLFIVRSIVEAHGGTIGVRSLPGRGTTFTVALPRKRMPGDAPTTAGSDLTPG